MLRSQTLSHHFNPSLIPSLKYNLRNVAAKQVTNVSLALKDSDMESENSDMVSDSQKKSVQNMYHICI